MKKYADVIVPLPVANRFTYSLPDEMEEKVQVGCRVIVPFGQRKFYTAIVVRLHDERPMTYETKEIADVLDASPVVWLKQLELWQWIATYYLCTLGDVYKAALPSGMKLESETLIRCNPDFEAAVLLPEREQKILDTLSLKTKESVHRLGKACGVKHIVPVIQSLLGKGAVSVTEELRSEYSPRTEARVRFANPEIDEYRLQSLLNEKSERASKQRALVMAYVALSGWTHRGCAVKEVSKKELLEKSGASDSTLSGMRKKQIFEVYYCETGRLDKRSLQTEQANPLNAAQQRAYDGIRECFKEKDVCLLHGVTSSGKTEIYIHLIEEALKTGKQVLYLVPEIALTAQITERLKRVFGHRLGIYHSKFPDAERVEIWQKQLGEERYDIILGVRSSVFLPFRDVGLVIVDEEHENTYKQQDPAPRYHGRSVAIVLASLFKAKVLLGTATPAIESYFNAMTGKYGLVELTERYQDIRLPRIEPVDIRELVHQKRMQGPFSPLLVKEMKEALERDEQVILFQNRRGFSPMVECRTCGWVPKCKNCDVSLTYHKWQNLLSCHYCGYTCSVPRVCPACEGTELANCGFGTERIEDDIQSIFPQAKVMRLDLDTTRTRTAYEKIIADFKEKKTHILIGTQMISKGLDFDHVSVVGILNADTLLNYPDFRSHEHAFQLMAQVAGRAGRKNKQGLVILQTKSPELPIIRQVVNNDYRQLYFDQLAERQLFKYPPYYRLIYVYLKHRKEEQVNAAADFMAAQLRSGLGARILGPDKPPVARIQTLFIKKIVIKVEQNLSMRKIRDYLLAVQRGMGENPISRSVWIYYDADPQ